jgi:hypothetical protein
MTPTHDRHISNSEKLLCTITIHLWVALSLIFAGEVKLTYGGGSIEYLSESGVVIFVDQRELPDLELIIK